MYTDRRIEANISLTSWCLSSEPASTQRYILYRRDVLWGSREDQWQVASICNRNQMAWWSPSPAAPSVSHTLTSFSHRMWRMQDHCCFLNGAAASFACLAVIFQYQSHLAHHQCFKKPPRAQKHICKVQYQCKNLSSMTTGVNYQCATSDWPTLKADQWRAISSYAYRISSFQASSAAACKFNLRI